MATIAFLFLFLLYTSVNADVFPAIYVFGDDTVDPGNNNAMPKGLKANHLPYGIDLYNPTGRFTNGKTIADFLALMRGLPIPLPYTNMSESLRKSTKVGINYGSAGCGILPVTKPVQFDCSSLDKQIDSFNRTVLEDLPSAIPDKKLRSQHLATSLFFICTGLNDYTFTYHPKMDPNAFADSLFNTLTQQLERLYAMGARKFLVSDITLLGCFPPLQIKSRLTPMCDGASNQTEFPYNHRLPFILQQCQARYSASTFVPTNTAYMIQFLVEMGPLMGIKNVSDPCCGDINDGHNVCSPQSKLCCNRNDYLFFDDYHINEATNYIIAGFVNRSGFT